MIWRFRAKLSFANLSLLALCGSSCRNASANVLRWPNGVYQSVFEFSFWRSTSLRTIRSSLLRPHLFALNSFAHVYVLHVFVLWFEVPTMKRGILAFVFAVLVYRSNGVCYQASDQQFFKDVPQPMKRVFSDPEKILFHSISSQSPDW